MDKHQTNLVLQPGNLVLIKATHLREALKSKAKYTALNKSSWHSLFKVVDEVNLNCYKIDLPEAAHTSNEVNVEFLKKYIDRRD